METTTIIYLVLAVLVGGGYAYFMFSRDGDGAPSVDSVVTRVQDAITIAATLVAAAEQMADDGQIAKDARFTYVFSRLQELFPRLSEDTLIALIEGAVWAVNQGVDLLYLGDAPTRPNVGTFRDES